eukprot:COSAG02_NODE_4_length_69935_cov_46.806590_5_plen_95_part_00
MDASTPEELADVVSAIMWAEAEPPREGRSPVEDSHVRYKPEDAVSLVHRVHPNFSVAKLKPYYPDRGKAQTELEPIPEPDPDLQLFFILARGDG